MFIENASVDVSVNPQILTPERARSNALELLPPAVRGLWQSLCIDQIALFVRAGESYELVCAGPGHGGSRYSAIGARSVERALGANPGPIPVEWQHGIAYASGKPLDAEDSYVLAGLGTRFLLGIPDGSQITGVVSMGGKGTEASGRGFHVRQRYWELEFAEEVQNRIFPAEHPRIQGLDYYSDWRPAPGLSGDYLDYFETPAGDFCMAIGDVAGKGVAAALLTSCLHSVAKALRVSGQCGPADMVMAMDELFYEICPDKSYATLFTAQYEARRGVLRYVNAGHESPLLLRKTARGYRTLTLEPTAQVIGMLRKSPFREKEAALKPGDLLVAYTDGLGETMNARGETWGFQRLLEAIVGFSYRKARDIVDGVLESAQAFAAGCPQHDDATLWLGRVEDGRRQLTIERAERMAAVA